MPNWTENYLSITGTKADLFDFQEFVKGEPYEEHGVTKPNPFCFNQIYPLPEELRNATSPPTIVTQEEYDTLDRDKHKVGIMGLPITETMQESFIRKYGTDNWYDWCIKNWGTKWTASYVHMNNQICIGDLASKEQGILEYQFSTPWDAPEPIFSFLKTRFNSLDIDWKFLGEGFEFVGNFKTDEFYTPPSLSTVKEVIEWKAQLIKFGVDEEDVKWLDAWEVELREKENKGSPNSNGNTEYIPHIPFSLE